MKVLNFLAFVPCALLISGCSVIIGPHRNFYNDRPIYCFPCFEANDVFGVGPCWIDGRFYMGYKYK